MTKFRKEGILMVVHAALLKRLESLECRFDGRNEIKVFIYYPEENPPYWKPEAPVAWQRAHPKRHAVILERRSCEKIEGR